MFTARYGLDLSVQFNSTLHSVYSHVCTAQYRSAHGMKALFSKSAPYARAEIAGPEVRPKTTQRFVALATSV